MRSDWTLKRWYNTINHKFFYGELPANVCVRWSSDEDEEKGFEDKFFAVAQNSDDGYHKYEIVLSKKKNPALSTILITLAHECIHIATGLRDNHGPVFEEWRQVLSDRGIFKKGALRKGLTIF